MKSLLTHAGRRPVILTLLLVLVAALASASYAYVFGGKRWPNNLARFRFNPNFEDPSAGDPNTQYAALLFAMNQWNNRSNLTFIDDGTTSQTNIANDGTNVVHYLSGSSLGNAVAFTNIFFSGNTFVDTDMRFLDQLSNGFDLVWAVTPNGSQYDMRHTAAHEFGHTAGLGHSAQSSAIMFATTPAGNLNDNLTLDDLLGLTRQVLHPTIVLNSVVPSAVNALQTGQTITVAGTGFVAGSTEVFLRRRNTNPQRLHALTNVNILSPTQLTAEIPPLGASSPWDVAVRINGDQARDRLNQVTYVTPPPPTVLSVMPPSGPLVGGNTVTIQGTNFTIASDVSVSFGGIPAALQQVDSPTQLVATVPTGAALGFVNVTVNTLGGSGTGVNLYQYFGNPPALVQVSSGAPRVGRDLVVELQGPSNRNCALLGDRQLGSAVKGGLTLELACTGAFRVLHDSFTGPDAKLDLTGRRQVVLPVPNRPDFVFRTFHLQGVVALPGVGAVTTNTLTFTIFP